MILEPTLSVYQLLILHVKSMFGKYGRGVLHAFLVYILTRVRSNILAIDGFALLFFYFVTVSIHLAEERSLRIFGNLINFCNFPDVYCPCIVHSGTLVRNWHVNSDMNFRISQRSSERLCQKIAEINCK